MDPSDGHEGADLGITFSERGFERYSNTIEDLKMGDHVRFNATLWSIGDTVHLHHLKAFFIEKTEGHMDVHALTSSKGRYKVRHTNSTDPLEGNGDEHLP